MSITIQTFQEVYLNIAEMNQLILFIINAIDSFEFNKNIVGQKVFQ